MLTRALIARKLGNLPLIDAAGGRKLPVDYEIRSTTLPTCLSASASAGGAIRQREASVDAGRIFAVAQCRQRSAAKRSADWARCAGLRSRLLTP